MITRRSMIQSLFSGLLAVGIRPATLLPMLRLPEDRFLEAWRRYVGEPDDANAIAVLDLLPEYQLGCDAPERRVAEEVDRTMGVLEGRVGAGHGFSAHLAMRLLTVTDGAVSECLDMIIGSYMHIDAKGFLEFAQRYTHFGGFAKMYCNLGLGFVDDPQGQADQISRRIQAVGAVDCPELKGIRDRVIKDLREKKSRLSTTHCT